VIPTIGFIANLLSYAVHLKALPERQLALAAAVSHHFAVISWPVSYRILDHFGLGLTRTQYYNLLRNSPLQKSDDSFKGLTAAFYETGFQFWIRLVPTTVENRRKIACCDGANRLLSSYAERPRPALHLRIHHLSRQNL
jgi:hypothetical protein